MLCAEDAPWTTGMVDWFLLTKTGLEIDPGITLNNFSLPKFIAGLFSRLTSILAIYGGMISIIL